MQPDIVGTGERLHVPVLHVRLAGLEPAHALLDDPCGRRERESPPVAVPDPQAVGRRAQRGEDVRGGRLECGRLQP